MSHEASKKSIMFALLANLGIAITKTIADFFKTRPEIEEILNLITLQLGDRIMVAVKAKMSPTQTSDELIDNINRCEAELHKAKTSVQWIFFEPDNKK